MILLSPIIYPITFIAYSVLGLVTIVGFAFGLTYPLAYLGDNEELKEGCKEAFNMCFESIAGPFVMMYGYVITGEMKLD